MILRRLDSTFRAAQASKPAKQDRSVKPVNVRWRADKRSRLDYKDLSGEGRSSPVASEEFRQGGAPLMLIFCADWSKIETVQVSPERKNLFLAIIARSPAGTPFLPASIMRGDRPA